MTETVSLLKSPKLIHSLMRELNKKVVGEEKTKLALIIHAAHIWVRNPELKLHLCINSESNAGKSHTAKKVFDLFPEDKKVYRNKLTPEVFTYWQTSNPQHSWDCKLLMLDDVKESLMNADTFKTMLSEGSIATVVKEQKAVDIEIKGKPNVILTTAENKASAEVENRFNFIAMDESSEQTIEIMKRQATTSAKGQADAYEPLVLKALEKLEPVDVVIPYGEMLWGLLPSGNIKARRDFPRFLELIKSSAALHQFQRERDENGRVLADGYDYEVARSVIQSLDLSEDLAVTSHNLKKAYDYAKELYKSKGYFTIQEIASFAPFVEERQWRRYLRELSDKGFLKIELEKPEKGRPFQVFTPLDKTTYSLPSFEKIQGGDDFMT
ncbi:hypothetical protein ACFL1B_05430 [Nanoarchaeota archaeon]